MYSSPGAAPATGRRDSSSTTCATPGIGEPIGTGSASSESSTRYTWLHTVPSDGPYSFANSAPEPAERWSETTSKGHASPATMTVRSDMSCAGSVSVSRSRYSDGRASTCVTRRRSTSDASSKMSSWRPSGGTTSVAPVVSVQNNPTMELSNENDESSRNRSTASGYTSDRATVEATMLRCRTMTPLGRPVEPLV
jgi:hypothetical protein